MNLSPSPVIRVAFEVPLEIARGLASGEMVRRGGVIQRASGNSKGQVVAWLRELGTLVPEGGSVASPVAEQLKTLQMATSALAVGQALTLGFSVLSFVILNRKLTALSAKVDGVLKELASVKEELAWLDRRQDIALEAHLRGALDQGDWAWRTGRIDALVGVRGSLVRHEHHYRGLLVGMLESMRAHRQAGLFSTYHGLFALAVVTRARCEALLDGPEPAIAALRAAKETVAELDHQFREPLRNLSEHLNVLRVAADRERLVRPALESMKETTQRVEGYEMEMAFCARHQISLRGWEGLSPSDGEAGLVLLFPTGAVHEPRGPSGG
jgi:hypothetical protein